jgi:hypothetical protein
MKKKSRIRYTRPRNKAQIASLFRSAGQVHAFVVVEPEEVKLSLTFIG